LHPKDLVLATLTHFAALSLFAGTGKTPLSQPCHFFREQELSVQAGLAFQMLLCLTPEARA
jgi:hypothetical protein